MKTGQIIAITGGVIAGTLLLGGGAFAAGVALGGPAAEARMERFDERGGDRDELMQRFGQERLGFEGTLRSRMAGPQGPGADCDGDHDHERLGPAEGSPDPADVEPMNMEPLDSTS